MLIALLALLLAFPAAAAADTVTGGPRAERITGTARADTLRGGGGNDRIFGRGGNDRLYGGSGDDRVYGGAGNDRIDVRGGGRDVVHCGPGRDTVRMDRSDRASGCERKLLPPSTEPQRPPAGGGTTQPPVPAPQPTAPQPAFTTGRYDGILTTTVAAKDACGGSLGTQTTRIPSSVFIGAPLRNVPAGPGLPAPVGGDDNPLDLKLLQPTVSASNAPGAIALASALLFNATSPSLILEYWSLSLNGGTLSGTLINDHRAEAAAFNLLAITDQLVPCRPELGTIPMVAPLAVGTRLTATLSATTVTLHLEGNVLRGDRAFSADIVATRVA